MTQGLLPPARGPAAAWSLRLLIRSLLRAGRHWALRRLLRRHGLPAILQAIYHSREPKVLLGQFGARVGDGTVVYPRLRVDAPDQVVDLGGLVIGRDAHVGRECFLDLADRIELADLAVLGMRTAVFTRDRASGRTAPVRILRGAVTGACVTILPGVTVGECAMVGGGAVVTRDVPDRSVVVGSPARVVRQLKPEPVV